MEQTEGSGAVSLNMPTLIISESVNQTRTKHTSPVSKSSITPFRNIHENDVSDTDLQGPDLTSHYPLRRSPRSSNKNVTTVVDNVHGSASAGRSSKKRGRPSKSNR